MNYDPAIEKANRNDAGIGMNPVINAQPVAAYEVHHGTVTAAPAAHQTQSHVAQGHASSVRPQPNRWRDTICDWPNNLFPSCYCVCCCCYGMYLLAQIAQKVGYATFACPLWAYCVIWLVGIILTAIFGASEFIILMPLLFSFFFALGLRLHIVQRDNITENGGCFGEFCCGFWCWYCSVAQMARHVYGYTKVLDGDGDPERPDNYAPLQQV